MAAGGRLASKIISKIKNAIKVLMPRKKEKRGENYRFVQTLLGSVTELRRFHSTFSNICIVARYRLVSVYADLLTTLIRWGLFFKITNNARLMI